MVARMIIQIFPASGVCRWRNISNSITIATMVIDNVVGRDLPISCLALFSLRFVVAITVPNMENIIIIIGIKQGVRYAA